MFAIGYGITMDVEDLKFAVLDQDKTPLSRNYIENIAGSRYFFRKRTLNSFEELDDQNEKWWDKSSFLLFLLILVKILQKDIEELLFG